VKHLRSALALLILAAVLAGCATQSPTSSGADALVGSLTDQLGVTNEQAIGGAGLIFDYAKEQLPSADFAKIADAVPGIDGLMGQATQLAGLSGPIGDTAGLASQFGKLGMGPEMVEPFGNVATDFLTKQAGSNVGDLLAGVL
jgi:Protein of unknown function VcgC/VcgE (DUF2780)